MAIRRHRRQKRRSMVGRRVHRHGAAPESEDRRICRILVAAFYECSQGIRRQFHFASHVLGGQQSWRIDCEAGAAELRCCSRIQLQMTRYQFLTDAYETEILKMLSV